VSRGLIQTEDRVLELKLLHDAEKKSEVSQVNCLYLIIYEGASIKDAPLRGGGGKPNGGIMGHGEGIKVNNDVHFKY